MYTETINVLYAKLETTVNTSDDKFLKQHFPVDPITGPEAYELDVKAYCILCHAAFEEYFESIARNVMTEGIKNWEQSKIPSETIIMLISYYGLRFELPKKESDNHEKVFDYIRKLLKVAKKRFSLDINENHGTSIKYLRKLLLPIAIDINIDPNIENSLSKLTSFRGTYAHKGFVNKPLAPEDAQNFVLDCLKLSEDVKNKVITKFE
jgi:hypothetical protein